MSIPKAAKYGGLVFDEAGRILLFEPLNHFDGYVWTFPKGKGESGEGPEETALREVREETGVEAEIVGHLAKAYPGGTGTAAYFLMTKLREHSFERGTKGETASVTWATEEEARGLIAQTTKRSGRERDLAVLADALAARRAK
jgi:ADP-ribose pyrophosphatase YjhB (NUDIX family)